LSSDIIHLDDIGADSREFLPGTVVTIAQKAIALHACRADDGFLPSAQMR
jgi:hypothetical protein